MKPFTRYRIRHWINLVKSFSGPRHHSNKLEAGHSIECITHASYSITFLHFLTFDPKIISLVVAGYPKVIPCTKFEHCGIICFWDIVRTDRQRITDWCTDRQSFTPVTVAGVWVTTANNSYMQMLESENHYATDTNSHSGVRRIGFNVPPNTL